MQPCSPPKPRPKAKRDSFLITGITGILGIISTTAAMPVAWVTWVLVRVTYGILQIFAELPPGPVESSGFAIVLLVAIVVIAGALLYPEVRNGWVGKLRAAGDRVASLLASPPKSGVLRSRRFAGLTLGLALISLSAVAMTLSSQPAHGLRVTFFETERGDAIFIETRGGTQAIIDGGGKPGEVSKSLGAVMPAWDRSLDLVVLTHPHADHVAGLIGVIESCEVDLILHPGMDRPSDIFEAWSSLLEATDAKVVVPPRDTRIQLGGEVYLDVLHAGLSAWSNDSNDGSIVLRLGYRDVPFLLTGDINAATELELMQSGKDVRSTVLKVPHHGSNGSSASEFLQAVDPAISVITVGTRNPFGHPHSDAVERIKKSTHADQVFLTTERGNVTIYTDGSKVWVSTAR